MFTEIPLGSVVDWTDSVGNSRSAGVPYALINSVSSGENGCPTSKGKVYPSPKHEAIKESKNQKPLPVNEKLELMIR